jgi:hypothetical protein
MPEHLIVEAVIFLAEPLSLENVTFVSFTSGLARLLRSQGRFMELVRRKSRLLLQTRQTITAQAIRRPISVPGRLASLAVT